MTAEFTAAELQLIADALGTHYQWLGKLMRAGRPNSEAFASADATLALKRKVVALGRQIT